MLLSNHWFTDILGKYENPIMNPISKYIGRYAIGTDVDMHIFSYYNRKYDVNKF